MSPSSSSSKHSSVSHVRVAVRARPLSSTEQSRGGKEIVNLNPRNRTVSVGANESGKCFTYDAVFDSNISQQDLYRDISRPLLDSFLDGYNATILAYGQTGSGKTYTMGSEDHQGDAFDVESKGLLPRFMEDIFESVIAMQKEQPQQSDTSGTEKDTSDNKSLDIKISASFLEVYGDDVFDLLDERGERKSLLIREDTSGEVAVSGLKAIPVSNVNEALNVLNQGTMNRTTASTLMNDTSSRSHAVFTISLVKSGSGSEDSMNMTASSRMTFVDLAGSERMKKTGAIGERAKEGIKINEGLLALGNVINALADDTRLSKGEKVFVPYRQSKLTRLLQGALGGNSQTLFLACVSPSDTNSNETYSSLQYANRARNIKNTLTKNVDQSVIEVHRLHALTNVLQCELVKHLFTETSSLSIMKDTDTTENQIVAISPQTKSNLSYQDLLLRTEVQEYIQQLHEMAEEKCQEKLSSGLKLPQKTTAFATVSSKSNRKSDDHCSVGSIKSVCKEVSKNVRKSDGHSSVASIKSVGEEASNISHDDINASFQELNPDEDMAMLDQLLEIQRKDQEFDDIQKVEIINIEKVEGELKEQENLLLQLRENIKIYHNIKEKYDSLMMEVSQLEKEKVQLAEELEKALHDPTKGCSKTIKKKLGGVESSLERARSEARKHQALCRKVDQEVNKCKVLEQKIFDLKQGKVDLMRRQREAAARHRDYTEVKTREINSLKKKERITGIRVLKLEMENKRHQTSLERRKQCCDKLSSKLKQTEDRLMKYLKIRKRVLNNRPNKRIRTPENIEFAPMCEDMQSTKTFIDSSVCNRVTVYQLTESYKAKMTEYGDTMEILVNKVKKLKELKQTEKSKMRRKNIHETEQSIQSLEGKLERVGSELDDLREKLPYKDAQFSLDGEKSELKGESKEKDTNLIQTVSKLCGPKARTLLLEFLNDITKSECHRVNLEDVLKRKESTIQKLSNGAYAFKQGDNLSKKTRPNKCNESSNNNIKLENELAGLNSILMKKEDDLLKSSQAVEELKRELEDSKEKINELEAMKKKKKKRVKIATENGEYEEVDMTVFDIDEDDLEFEDCNDSDYLPTPAKPKRPRVDKNKSQSNISLIMNNKDELNYEAVVIRHEGINLENDDESHLEGETILSSSDQGQHQALIHLDTLKVFELKDLLRKQGMPVLGKKKDLLLRLRKSICEEGQNKKNKLNFSNKTEDNENSFIENFRSSTNSSSSEKRKLSVTELFEKRYPNNEEYPDGIENLENINIFHDLQPSTDFENETDSVVSEEFCASDEKDNEVVTISSSEENEKIFKQNLHPSTDRKDEGEICVSKKIRENENELDVSINEWVLKPTTNETNHKFSSSEENEKMFKQNLHPSIDKKDGKDIRVSKKIRENETEIDLSINEWVLKPTSNETNDKIFLQSLRPTTANKISIPNEVKIKENENELDLSINEWVLKSTSNETNDKIFLQSLRSSTETKRCEEKKSPKEIYRICPPEEKHYMSTNKENEDIFLQSLRPSTDIPEIRKKTPIDDRNSTENSKHEFKKRKVIDEKERYRKPLESKSLRKVDENPRAFTNEEAFRNSLRSTSSAKGVCSQPVKRKFSVEGNEGFKRRKHMLNQKLLETEKLLEDI